MAINVINVSNLANGNPGAFSFLMELVTQHPEKAISIIDTIERTSIVGTDLYVLWSDLCNKDMNKVEKLCKNCPNDVLIDACSRQDYSGIKLVSKYLE